MQVVRTEIPDVLVIEPRVHGDHRGFFLESYQQKAFNQATGQAIQFVQDNHSGSRKNVLRGLHYQLQQTQGKLVRVLLGSIYDVVVDIRRASPTFGKYVGVELSAQNRRMLWAPKGFAHGFLTLSDWSEVFYKASDYYSPEHERSILWSDPEIGIAWPLAGCEPEISSKDKVGTRLADAEIF